MFALTLNGPVEQISDIQVTVHRSEINWFILVFLRCTHGHHFKPAVPGKVANNVLSQALYQACVSIRPIILEWQHRDRGVFEGLRGASHGPESAVWTGKKEPSSEV